MIWAKRSLDLITIGSVMYCNCFFFLRLSDQKWKTCYLFRWHFPVKILIWVIIPRRRICDSEVQWMSTPVRWLTATHTPQNIRLIHAEEPCRCTNHVKMIIPQITAIAGFTQRLWQRQNLRTAALNNPLSQYGKKDMLLLPFYHLIKKKLWAIKYARPALEINHSIIRFNLIQRSFFFFFFFFFLNQNTNIQVLLNCLFHEILCLV